MLGLNLVAEAILRVEHKLDQLLSHLKVKTQPMQFYDNRCGICQQPVLYMIDLQHNIVKRKCNCSTGKQPSMIPLMEQQGVGNGNEANHSSEREDRTSPANDGGGRRHGRSR